MIVSLHDGDHDGVVRISVDLSCVLRGLIRLFIYAAQFFPYQEYNNDCVLAYRTPGRPAYIADGAFPVQIFDLSIYLTTAPRTTA